MFTLHSPINHTVLENGFWAIAKPEQTGHDDRPAGSRYLCADSKRPIRADARRFGRSGSSGYPRI